MKNILIAIDFHEHTDYLVDTVLSSLNTQDAKIWLIHIASPDPDFVGYGVGPHYIRDIRAEDLRGDHKKLAAYSQKLQEKGFSAEGLLIQGPTIEMILEEAKKLEADLIAMGHHEHDFMYRLFFSSVASSVVQQAKIPVLVVPIPN